jgi:hypothetical protein
MAEPLELIPPTSNHTRAFARVKILIDGALRLLIVDLTIPATPRLAAAKTGSKEPADHGGFFYVRAGPYADPIY